MNGFSKSYYLIDIHKDKEQYYAIPDEIIYEKNNYQLLIGKILNLFMDGKLEESDAILASMPQDSLITMSLNLVNPTITWKGFIDIFKNFQETNRSISTVVLTAGRPFLLNGFNDFTRIGPFLEKNKDLFIDLLSRMYGTESTPYIYHLCLAEYYYQQNRLYDAIDLVGSCINDFSRKNEHRLLFSALFLQSKILLADGTTDKVQGFLDEIKNRLKKEGRSEFDYNLSAVETYFALFEGNYSKIQHWLTYEAPDEYENFNMLDLYRYMIKMRCYLISDCHTALVALAEKLRPLLETGRRFQDLCEIDLLLAMSLYSINKQEEAFDILERALRIARRRNYIRLVCDEGPRMFVLLADYINARGNNDFIMMLAKTTRKMAVQYPYYLDVKYTTNQKFTQREIEILYLLEQGWSKEEIAKCFFLGEDSIKYHLKKIYTKLDADNAVKAIWNARQTGIIK